MKKILVLLLAVTFNSCFAAFTYDDSGNLTSDSVYRYIYNDASRVKEVQIGNTGIVKAKYFYDHQGQRIKKIEDGQTCYYISSDHRSCNDKSTTFHFVENQRIASNHSDGKAEFLHNDHLGSPFAISDKNGTVISRLKYESYGKPTAIPNSPLQGSYAFSGKELSNTNSYYFEARSLSPSLGSFNRPDPVLPIVGNSFSLNPYQYANNNPLSYVDNDGELAFIPIAIFLAREYAAYKLSEATGGASDFLSLRRLGINAVKKIGSVARRFKGNKDRDSKFVKGNLPVIRTAQAKLDILAKKFSTKSSVILTRGLKGTKFIDRANGNNINIFSSRLDGKKGFIRITLDPDGVRVISAGLIKVRNLRSNVKNGRFTAIKD